MKLPAESRTNITNDLKISRILNGMWQVSGAHGYINKEHALEAMETYVENGFITWDLADHYGPAEDFVKEFRTSRIRKNKEASLKDVRFFTKWVPRPQPISKQVVKNAIDM